MHIFKVLLLPFLFGAASLTASAQCFQAKLSQAQQAFSQKKYLKSLEYLDLAALCPDQNAAQLKTWRKKNRDAVTQLLSDVAEARDRAQEAAESNEKSSALYKNASLALQKMDANPTLALGLMTKIIATNETKTDLTSLYQTVLKKVDYPLVQDTLLHSSAYAFDAASSPSGQFWAVYAMNRTAKKAWLFRYKSQNWECLELDTLYAKASLAITDRGTTYFHATSHPMALASVYRIAWGADSLETVLQNTHGIPESCLLSPNARYLMTISERRVGVLYDMETQKRLTLVEMQGRAAAFLSEKDLLLQKEGRHLNLLKIQEDTVQVKKEVNLVYRYKENGVDYTIHFFATCAVLSPAQDNIAIATQSELLQFSWPEFQLLTRTAIPDGVEDLKWTKEGIFVAGGTKSYATGNFLWFYPEANLSKPLALHGHEAPVLQMAVGENGEGVPALFALAEDLQWNAWPLEWIKQKEEVHPKLSQINSLVAKTKNKLTFWAGYTDVKIFNADTRTVQTKKLQCKAAPSEVYALHDTLWLLRVGNTIAQWNSIQEEEAQPLLEGIKFPYKGNAMLYLPTENAFLLRGDKALYRWEITRNTVDTLLSERSISAFCSQRRKGNTALWLAEGSFRTTVKLFSYMSNKKVTLQKESESIGRVFSMALSPDGKYIACGGFKEVWILSAEDLSKVAHFSTDNPKEHQMDALAWTPDSKYCYAGGYAGTLWAIDVEQKKRISEFNAGGIVEAIFTDDKKLYYSAHKQNLKAMYHLSYLNKQVPNYDVYELATRTGADFSEEMWLEYASTKERAERALAFWKAEEKKYPSSARKTREQLQAWLKAIKILRSLREKVANF